MNIKKAKGTNKCVIKCKLIFENYINSLLNDKIILQSQQRFKSDHHNVYTEEINRIPLSSNDGKRLQTFYRITMYPDQSYRIRIIGGSGSRKTNAFLNVINNQPALIKYICMLRMRMKRINNFLLFLINKRKSTGLKYFNDPKAFTEYSNGMQGL